MDLPESLVVPISVIGSMFVSYIVSKVRQDGQADEVLSHVTAIRDHTKRVEPQQLELLVAVKEMAVAQENTAKILERISRELENRGQ